VGVYGGAFFLIINGCLFMRLVAADFPQLLGKKRSKMVRRGIDELVPNGQKGRVKAPQHGSDVHTEAAATEKSNGTVTAGLTNGHDTGNYHGN